MRNVSTVVAFVLLVGCGIEKDDDVSLQKIPVSWPLTGGLDTKKSPLAIQPGSHLVLDDVVQERLNEWRHRNGFTQVTADTMPEAAPYFVGALGDSGMFEAGKSGLEPYSPSSAARWAPSINAVPIQPQHRSRKPIVANDLTAGMGFARVGNILAIGASVTGSTSSETRVTTYDAFSGAAVDISGPLTGVTLFRGAATASFAVMFAIDPVSGLRAFTVNSTGQVTSTTTVATAFTRLDAYWYGGATITVVAATAAGAVSFLEFNPSTPAFTTNVVLAGVLGNSALALLADPLATGTRYVGTSGTTPTTRVIRCSSAGAILTNDQVEAVASTKIAGIGTNAGNAADWSVIYQTTAPNLRVNQKVNNAIGSPLPFKGSLSWGAGGTLDSQAWADSSIDSTAFFLLIGLHSQNPDDPQDSWAEFYIPLPGGQSAPTVVSTPSSLSAGPSLSALYQVVRTSALHFSTLLPVQVVYEDNAGVIVRHYSLDLFEQTYLTSADDAVTLTQKPLKYKQTSFVPGGQISYFDESAMKRLGTASPPRIPTGVGSTAAGALTLLAQYGYKVVIETIDSDGNIWRSPPTPGLLVTLAGTQNTITVTYSSWSTSDYTSATIRVAIYRTAANGSSYRRIYSTLAGPGLDVVYVDLLADTAIVDGEVLYVQGELETAITPPAHVIWFHDDRLWAANREYPTEVWYTKNLRPGRQPEFTNEGIVDLDDEFGDITNGASLDTQNVVFKKNAIYFGSGDGFTDSGSGTNYRFDRISSDQGALPGSPVVNTGNVLYFVGERGIHTVNKQGVVDFTGSPVDQWINQPLVSTRETVLDGCFVSTKNDVVFLTTNYLLIHNLTFNYWRRVTGLAGMRRCLVVNGQLVLFKNDGTMWREGDHTVLTDGSSAMPEGIIRSPWMRPTQGSGGPGTGSTATAGQQGMRIYRGRVTYTRTAGGSTVALRGRIYRNNDDADLEEFTSSGIAASKLSGTGEMVPKVSKCTSFSLALVIPAGDCTVRVDGFAALVGTREGAQVTGQGDRWK